jgi:hypothetical protein
MLEPEATRTKHKTPLPQRPYDLPPLPERRHRPTMRGVGTRCSNEDEETNLPGSCANTTPTTSIERNHVAYTHQVDALNTTKLPGPPPRHPATLPRTIDRQHHLLGPPSQRNTARARATMPHDLVARSPSYTGQTARRPCPEKDGHGRGKGRLLCKDDWSMAMSLGSF